jgi:hypothetical protein
MESFKLPEEESKDETSKETEAIESAHFLKKNRAWRESWLESEAAMNDVIVQNQAKGESNETIIRKLLEQYLPPKFGIVEGFLIDRNGVQSKQNDVIIYDRFSHPYIVFETLEESKKTNKFIPIDSAVATIEVKTTLKGKVRDAIDNIHSTRTELKLIRPLVTTASWGEHYYIGWPTSFIFAFKSGWKNTKSIKKAVRTNIKRAQINPKSFFDLIYVHDKDVTLGWVFGYERTQLLVRPCDHWDKPLHLTEIILDNETGTERLGLLHFLSQVVTFVTRFQVPQLDWLLHHYGPPVRMKYNTDDEPILTSMNELE